MLTVVVVVVRVGVVRMFRLFAALLLRGEPRHREQNALDELDAEALPRLQVRVEPRERVGQLVLLSWCDPVDERGSIRC